jgi:hypothetical protein
MAHIALQTGNHRPVSVQAADGLGLDHVSHFGCRGVGADEINLARIDRGDVQGQCNRLGDSMDIRQNQIAAVIVA